MIKIYNPNKSEQQMGGGWTFRSNLEMSLKDRITFVDNWQDCDIFLISSVTIVDKTEVHQAKAAGKKIVIRVDNMPRMSRNRRMHPHERMREFACMADRIVYQSKWSMNWIGSYIGFPEKSLIIYNGVDTKTFYKKPENKKGYNIFLVIQYNRDENKRIPEALDMFTKEWLKDKRSKLIIIGRFSPEIVDANFDFFREEPYEYLGVIQNREELANAMRRADILLYPSYSDALPNTCTEAVACGLTVWHRGHAGVGEACTIPDPSLERMGNEYLKLFETL